MGWPAANELGALWSFLIGSLRADHQPAAPSVLATILLSAGQLAHLHTIPSAQHLLHQLLAHPAALPQPAVNPAAARPGGPPPPAAVLLQWQHVVGMDALGIADPVTGTKTQVLCRCQLCSWAAAAAVAALLGHYGMRGPQTTLYPGVRVSQGPGPAAKTRPLATCPVVQVGLVSVPPYFAPDIDFIVHSIASIQTTLCSCVYCRCTCLAPCWIAAAAAALRAGSFHRLGRSKPTDSVVAGSAKVPVNNRAAAGRASAALVSRDGTYTNSITNFHQLAVHCCILTGVCVCIVPATQQATLLAARCHTRVPAGHYCIATHTDPCGVLVVVNDTLVQRCPLVNDRSAVTPLATTTYLARAFSTG